MFLRNCCQGTFSSIYIKVFFILMLFLRTKTFSEAWKMRYFFQKIFYCLHFHDKRAQNLNIYQYFFWFCKFQFYIYILTNFQGCVVLFAQNILFQRKRCYYEILICHPSSTQKLMIQPTLIHLYANEHSQEFHCYPFAVTLDRYVES